MSRQTAICRSLPEGRSRRSNPVRAPEKYSSSSRTTSANPASSRSPSAAASVSRPGGSMNSATSAPSSATNVSGPIGDPVTVCVRVTARSCRRGPTTSVDRGSAQGVAGEGVALLLRLLLALLRLLAAVLGQPVELAADEVPGGELADGHPQPGQLPREVLGVGPGGRGPRAVLLGLHPVAVGLPVLRQQDQRRGVGGLG